MKTGIIKNVEVKVLELPLKKQWKISLYEQTTRAHAVVRIQTDEGVTGYGEAAPSPAFMGETGYTMETVIKRYLADAVAGESVFYTDRLHEKMNAAIYGNYAAKAALDMAFYDAMGKLTGVPACRLMGGKYRDRVALSWVVGMQDLDASIEEAKEKLKLGYRVLKIKVGRTPETDTALVKRIRAEVGDDVPLRLDANQGYDAVTALQVFGRLEEFGLESIEQPVRRWDIRGMKMLRERLKTPVMADESVSDFHAVGQMIRESACDYVNIKVGKVGGLTMAKKIAAALEAEGLLATAGSNLEVGIGSAASIHFSAATPNVSLPGDLLLGGPLHQHDIIVEDFEVNDGFVTVPDTPGLGIEVDESIFK